MKPSGWEITRLKVLFFFFFLSHHQSLIGISSRRYLFCPIASDFSVYSQDLVPHRELSLVAGMTSTFALPLRQSIQNHNNLTTG